MDLKLVSGEQRVSVLLDRSGSMASCRDSTIAAYNEYVKGLPGRTLVTLVIFDSHDPHEIVYENVPAEEVPLLTPNTFVPRGGTPLRDAIGKLVTRMEQQETSGTTVLVILTDGQENQSREYSQEAIKAKLEQKQNENGWLVIYLGANQDAWSVGQGLGMQLNSTMTYSTDAVGATLASVARSTRSYLKSGDRTEAAFTQEERTRSVGGTVEP